MTTLADSATLHQHLAATTRAERLARAHSLVNNHALAGASSVVFYSCGFNTIR